MHMARNKTHYVIVRSFFFGRVTAERHLEAAAILLSSTASSSKIKQLHNHQQLRNIKRLHACQSHMMRPGLMRTLLPSRIFHASNNGNALASAAKAATAECSNPPSCLRNCRCFARVQDLDSLNREVWFSSSAPRSSPELGGGGDHKQPDERTLQLGKSRWVA